MRFDMRGGRSVPTNKLCARPGMSTPMI
jgi:hypothetical protein